MSFIQQIEEMDQTLMLKGLQDPDSSTSSSRTMTVTARKRKEYFESTKMRLTDKMEELYVAIDKIESDHLEFLKSLSPRTNLGSWHQPRPSHIPRS